MKYTESSIVKIFHAANVNRFFSCLAYTFFFFKNILFFLWFSTKRKSGCECRYIKYYGDVCKLSYFIMNWTFKRP